jgi:hypothetical protein
MCRNLIVLALVLGLASISYGYTFGDWEAGSLGTVHDGYSNVTTPGADGWDNAFDAGFWIPGGTDLANASISTIGVTSGHGSLKVIEAVGSATGVSGYDTANPNLYWMLRANFGDCWLQAPAPTTHNYNEAAGVLASYTTFEVDVTRLAADWAGMGTSSVTVCMLGDGFWGMAKGFAPWDATMGDSTMTVSVVYRTGDPDNPGPLGFTLPPNPSWRPGWFQVVLGTEAPDAAVGSTGVFYLDRARLTPEPASALIMALGATIISLRRRKQ